MLRGFKEGKLVLNCYDLVRLPARRNSILTNKNSQLFVKTFRSARTIIKATSLNFSAVDVRHFPSSKLRLHEIAQRFSSTTNIKVNRGVSSISNC